MDFVKQWTFCVCITVVVSVIFSLLTPKGNMGRFYKLIISLFIFVSFLYPFGKFNYARFDFSKLSISSEIENNTNSIANQVIENKIVSLLEANQIYASSAKCFSSVNQNGEVQVDNITVSVAQEYDVTEVKNIIFEKLSLNVKVIHVGE